jgi:hypothetical protein
VHSSMNVKLNVFFAQICVGFCGVEDDGLFLWDTVTLFQGHTHKAIFHLYVMANNRNHRSLVESVFKFLSHIDVILLLLLSQQI